MPTNKVVERAAAIAAEKEFCKLKDMTFLSEIGVSLGDDRYGVTNGRADTGTNKYGGRDKGGDGGGETMRDIREHFDFLSI